MECHGSHSIPRKASATSTEKNDRLREKHYTMKRQRDQTLETAAGVLRDSDATFQRDDPKHRTTRARSPFHKEPLRQMSHSPLDNRAAVPGKHRSRSISRRDRKSPRSRMSSPRYKKNRTDSSRSSSRPESPRRFDDSRDLRATESKRRSNASGSKNYVDDENLSMTESESDKECHSSLTKSTPYKTPTQIVASEKTHSRQRSSEEESFIENYSIKIETEDNLMDLMDSELSKRYSNFTEASVGVPSNAESLQSQPQPSTSKIQKRQILDKHTTRKSTSSLQHNRNETNGDNVRDHLSTLGTATQRGTGTSTRKAVTLQNSALAFFPRFYPIFRIITLCSQKNCQFAIFHECCRTFVENHHRALEERDALSNENHGDFVQPQGKYVCPYCYFEFTHRACWRKVSTKTADLFLYHMYQNEHCDTCKVKWIRVVVQPEYKRIWNRTLKGRNLPELDTVLCHYNQVNKKCDCGCIEIHHQCVKYMSQVEPPVDKR